MVSHNLLRYALKRFLLTIPVLFGVSVIVFLIIHIAPGGPVEYILGDYGSQEAAERIEEQLHLNEPVYVQYYLWMKNALLHGDLGMSWAKQPNVAVFDLIVDRVPLTAQLAGTSFVLASLIGIPVGIISAVRQDQTVDHVSRIAALTGISIPNFWLGIIFIVLFGVHFGIDWAVGGYVPLAEDPIRSFQQLIFPTIALGTAQAAIIVRMMRSEMLDTINQDYIKCAQAMGIGRYEVILKDATKNALIPVVTVMGLSLAGLLNGAVLIETVFGLPGLGSLLIDSINQRDYRLVQAIILFMSLVYVMANFLVDLLYAYLDPRIRYGGSE